MITASVVPTVSATATRMTAAIVAPTCGIRSRNPAISASTSGKGSPSAHRIPPPPRGEGSREPGDGGGGGGEGHPGARGRGPRHDTGDDRDRDVADQRGGDRRDRVLEHRTPARLHGRPREAEQPVGD